MSDTDSGHLYYCKKQLSMNNIDSCTRIQLGSFDDHLIPNIGDQPYTMQSNNQSYGGYRQQSTIGTVPVKRYEHLRSGVNRNAFSSA
jgi:hypothetical protein